MINATIITDSIGVDAPRLTSIELVYPRFIHAEFMTHRVFSRNASSSRAIPVAKMHAAIRENPAMPVEWRMNEAGMQGFTVATETTAIQAESIWKAALESAVNFAEMLNKLGLHKQHVNRLTEPFQHIRVILTATDFLNWDGLRDHEAAEPNIQALAKAISTALDGSKPKLLKAGQWHLPYIENDDFADISAWFKDHPVEAQQLGALTETDVLKRVSAARCARVSYRTHDGKRTDIEADLKLFHKLLIETPIHASPAEHQAAPDAYLIKGKRWMTPEKHGNLRGWCQHRKFLANENLQDMGMSAAA